VSNYDKIKNKGYKKDCITTETNISKDGKIVEKEKEVSGNIGMHVHTFNVFCNMEEAKSIFYNDATTLSDIILLMRFFHGSYICLENELEIAWNKYLVEPLDNNELFIKHTKPKIEYILTNFNRERIQANKLHISIFLYMEIFKSSYIDVQIAILSPVLNILVDLWDKNNCNSNPNEKELENLYKVKDKINNDDDYDQYEKEKLSIALTKYINSLNNDMTTKTANFVKQLKIISRLEYQKDYNKKIEEFAQLINALRNGIIHSGNLKSHNTEKKFEKIKKDEDKDTLKDKIRVVCLAKILIQNAILELLDINSYCYQSQDIETISEFLQVGTFRGM